MMKNTPALIKEGIKSGDGKIPVRKDG